MLNQITASRVVLFAATMAFLAWTLLSTVMWPVEDYADITHAYAESTDRIARGMSIGVTGYLSVAAVVIGWNVTRRKES